MNKLLLSPEAGRDLKKIREYIANELKNPIAARNIVQSIKNDLRILEDHAEAGPSIEAMTGFSTSLRTLVCGKHIAVYNINGQTVRIARILDGRQDYLRILFGDDYLE